MSTSDEPVITAGEPVARTAGEEDHSNPDVYRGEDAEAPDDTGKPQQVD